MSVAAQANVIKALFENWVAERGGVVLVASNLRDLWAQASQSSQKPIILICYTGERARGPFSRAAVSNRVDQQWTVAIVRGRGFTTPRGDTLSVGSGNIEAFYDCVEAIRDTIRNASNLSAEWPVDYKGIRPMQFGSMIIDGYLIEFSVAIDIQVLTNLPT